MSKTYKSIMRGIREIDAHQKESKKLRSVTLEIEPTLRYDAGAVKRLRLSLKLSQRAFALLCGVSIKTVEAWEAGRNEPNGSARRLFELIEKDKGLLEREGIMVV